MGLSTWIRQHDNIYFAVRNKKVLIGCFIFLFFLCLAVFGPMLVSYGPEDIAGDPRLAPSMAYPLGTDYQGHDLLTLLFYGLRSAFILGLLGGTLATVIGLVLGFIAGYKGKLLDESLMMITNVILVMPTIALLIVVASYLEYRGVVIQSVIIGCIAWPWTARAVRAQTLSIKSKEFVNLSRISSHPTLKIIKEDIATNMLSYCFMVFILQFNGAILAAVGLDFIGLGPTNGTSIGLILFNLNQWNAIQLGLWWWVLFPGLALTLLVTSLYLINIGLDEVFNPRLREM